MASAPAVSRFLAQRGVHRAEWWPSAAIRGWGTQTSGFRVERGTELGVVKITHVIGDDNRSYTHSQRRGVYDHALSTMARKLEERYDVALITCAANDRDDYIIGHIIVRDKPK